MAAELFLCEHCKGVVDASKCREVPVDDDGIEGAAAQANIVRPRGPRKLKGEEPIEIGTPNCEKDMRRKYRLSSSDLPDGIPLGPFELSEGFFTSIEGWAKSTSRGGGTFGIKWGTLLFGNSLRGTLRTITCSRAQKPKDPRGKGERDQVTSSNTNCKWHVKIEHCVEGWC